MNIDCVLFDLDGTLIDTAPDLIASLNVALNQHGFSTISPERIKPHVSFGASAMINASIEEAMNSALHADILQTMLAEYEANIAQYSQFFDGISDVLDFIESKNVSWGIVTNKRERFTKLLVEAFNLKNRAVCVISGDTTSHSKPHPAPLFEACRQANVEAKNCVYIGDAAHDIIAGKNAQMFTLAATYGYLQLTDNPKNWDANALIQSPYHLLDWLKAVL